MRGPLHIPEVVWLVQYVGGAIGQWGAPSRDRALHHGHPAKRYLFKVSK